MDKRLKDRLVNIECQQQLLTRLVRGAIAWQREGLPSPLPDKMKVAMQSYMADNDDLQDYLNQSCELRHGFEVMTIAVLSHFNLALFKKKHPAVSEKALVKMMQDKEFTKKQFRNPRLPARAIAWQGVRIRDIHEDVHQNVQVDTDDE